MKRLAFLTLGLLLAAIVTTGCKSSQTMVNNPSVTLDYLLEPSQDNITNLSKAYSQTINRNRRKEITQPGLFSDYAVTLALLNQPSESNKWFNKEIATYPSSRPYIQQLKVMLIPEYAGDTTLFGPEDEYAGAESVAMNTAVKTTIDESNVKGSDPSGVQVQAGSKDKKLSFFKKMQKRRAERKAVKAERKAKEAQKKQAAQQREAQKAASRAAKNDNGAQKGTESSKPTKTSKKNTK